ncbi:unnamed protein product, partial [Ixodes persulcatus]
VSCANLQLKGKSESGQYTIYSRPHTSFVVSCDMESDGGGWTTRQTRALTATSYSTWKCGIYTRFDPIDQPTPGLAAARMKCTFLLERSMDATLTPPTPALFVSSASIISLTVLCLCLASTEHDFVCACAGYDALSSHDGHPFSVKKSEQHSGDRCVSNLSGGWWFNGCIQSNLNGRKFEFSVPRASKGLGITWYNRNDEHSYYNVYFKVEMKIRDANFEFYSGSLTYAVH